MNASKLIVKLQKLVDKYGDFPVRFSGSGGYDKTIKLIEVYDKNGMSPDQENFTAPAEFYLW